MTSKRHVWTTNIQIIAQIDKYKNNRNHRTQKILMQILHFFCWIFPLVIVDWGGLRQQVFLRTEREWEGNYCSKGLKNIAKGTTDPRVEFISQVFTQILIKFQFQNLNSALTSKSQQNISILTKLKLKHICPGLFERI